VQEFFIALPVLLLSMVAHEYAHGYAALKQGDPTAALRGRLTLNPLRHIDLFLTVLMPLMLFLASGGRVVFGGAKPVPVDPRNYRNYKRGDVIVSLAGIAVNLGLFVSCLVLSVAVGLLGKAVGGGGGVFVILQRMLTWGVWLNLLLAFFNLIPVPPLDGSHVLYHVLPGRWAARYRTLGRYGFLVLLLLVFAAPRVLYTLLTPAFVLQRIACDVMMPHAIGPIPVCRL
jgi:Zn-dependent protease